MGMAASQARFLGLTARKTNVEYEGQQVNQQRTALSNESAGLFNQMLSLQVPVPPSATDYYNMRYSYEQGGQTYEITNYTASTTNAGTYDVTVRTAYDVVNYTNIILNENPQTQVTQTLYSKTHTDAQTGQTTESYYMLFGTSGTEYALSGPALNTTLSSAKGLDAATLYYTYNRDGSNYYMTEAEVRNHATAQGYNGQMQAYRQDNSKQVQDTTYNGVNLLTDSTGKFSYITLPDGTQYALGLDEISDDAGFDEAMNDYNYQKMLYDKTIQDINAKTEKIQAQDRSLELRLKQLDTEQEALSKEMEAIKDVIQKNVENTFKTFA